MTCFTLHKDWRSCDGVALRTASPGSYLTSAPVYAGTCTPAASKGYPLLLGHMSAQCRLLGHAPCRLIFLDELAADVDDDLTDRAGELERRLVYIACYGSARVVAAAAIACG